MSEQIVQVADAATPTKNMRTIQQTVGGNTVQSEVIVLATGAAGGNDTYDSRQIRTLTSTDIVTSILSDGTNTLKIYAGNTTIPNDSTLRRIAIGLPSGVTLPVSLAAGSTVTANQGTRGTAANAWYELNMADSFTVPGTNALLQVDDASFAGLRPLFVEPVGSAGQLLQQDASNNLKVAQQGTVTVTQNLLGSTDQPDVTVNHAGSLPVTIPVTYIQPAKGSWGPGWGNFRGW